LGQPAPNQVVDESMAGDVADGGWPVTKGRLQLTAQVVVNEARGERVAADRPRRCGIIGAEDAAVECGPS
jgi:hypothetical protein